MNNIMKVLAKKLIAEGCITKMCSCCNTKLPLSFFHTRSTKCKDCKSTYSKVKNNTPEGKIKTKAYNDKPIAYARRHAYSKTESAKYDRRNNRKNYIEINNNHDKVRARQAVADALRYGNLTKQSCSVCGSVDKIEAHHEDYSKRLTVLWLCKVHHDELHKRYK